VEGRRKRLLLYLRRWSGGERTGIEELSLELSCVVVGFAVSMMKGGERDEEGEGERDKDAPTSAANSATLSAASSAPRFEFGFFGTEASYVQTKVVGSLWEAREGHQQSTGEKEGRGRLTLRRLLPT
jgi:hypothetical protein